MKKKNINLKKLQFCKETLAELNIRQQNNIWGGAQTINHFDTNCITYYETCATIPWQGHICNILC
jgi:hypothetical protein